RFRHVPTFGRGVIRRFSDDTLSMKRLAARDFEDILQCAMPIFEGLLPTPHDTIVQTLLFRFAEWHAYAKLRLHTELTLDSMSQSLTSLTEQLRKFCCQVCDNYDTTELPKERAAWYQREALKENQTTDAPSSSPKKKSFNMRTYKFHALGNYVQCIKLFGTTDSFTMQIVGASWLSV
ncbi:hypothetical protein DFJ58DRAFT_670212, partial [Suillus subalutaceus]|uniref:uncharacterized protein n=1 Tax=Suillus subalutaceus TaxID=48586 RepID=UPI001B87D660